MANKINIKTWLVMAVILVMVLGWSGVAEGVEPYASNPDPADGSTVAPEYYEGNVYMVLDYTPGLDANTHTAFFSDNKADVDGRDPNHSLGSVPPWPAIYDNAFVVGYDDPAIPEYARAPLVLPKTYYWCVDGSDGSQTWLGSTWSFTPIPKQAWGPNPYDGEIFVPTNGTMTWSLGDQDLTDYTLSYNVYIGTDETAVADANVVLDPSVPEYAGNVSTESYDYSGLAGETEVFWRVDTKLNLSRPPFPIKIISGDVWSFTTPIYVQADAPGANDGSSWQNAFIHLQDALTHARSRNGIFVAQGTYKPDANTANPTGTGDRTATFQLKNGVTIKGGYAGFGEPDPNARDINLYKTILSGDIGTPGDNWDNSYHVVTGSLTDATAILDGFTITAGNANGNWPNHSGGGMCNDNGSSPMLTNCTFSGNSAHYDGGGMRNYNNSNPMLTNCTFSGNTANLEGGGMCNDNGSSPMLTNCTFSGNSAYYDGGGMRNYNNSNPMLTNCTFSGNHADDEGGGMYNNDSSPILTNCTFTGNSTSSAGAGIYNTDSSPTLINCAFSANSARYYGGGIFNHTNSSPTMVNCTFSGNSANTGGGICNWDGSNPTVTNCILWGNSDSGGYDESAQIFDYNSTPIINYSCVQGWTGSLGGAGNIGDDPMFKDADGPDDILGTEDDDLWLSAGSPCIDAGYNPAVPPSAVVDLDGNHRFFDDVATVDTGSGAPPIVDIGAYEFYHSLVAHWRLDEGAGTIAYDSSGNGHHGTAQSDPTRVDGPPGYGTAMYFDGNDPAPAWVNCGTWNPSAQTGQLTVATWVQWDGPNGEWQGLIGKRDGWDDEGTQMMWFLQIDKYDHDVSFERGGSYPWCGGIVLPEGEWSHVAATFDGSTMVFYVDGAETGRGDFSFGAKTDATIAFGCVERNGWCGFNGALDDIRLYNYALSTDEVRWLLCARPPRGDLNRDCRVDFVDVEILALAWLTEPGQTGWIVDMGAYEWDPLVAHWKLNERGGTMAWDSSGNSHHGTLYGDPNWKPADGQIAGALQFDGVDDYVNAPHIPFDNRSFTIAMWVNPVLYTAQQVVFSQHQDGSTNLSMHFRLGGPGGIYPNPGAVRMGFYDNDLDTAAGIVADNTWYHITFWYDFENQTRRIYMDGVQAAEDNGDPYLGTSGDTRIGQWDNGGQWFMGIIDDVRIYNYALSGDEIRWLLCAKPRGDLNRDCRVDFVDFAILASGWLDCGMMVQELCGQ